MNVEGKIPPDRELYAPSTGGHCCRVADLHVSRLSRGNTVLLTRVFEERAKRFMQKPQLAYVPLGRGSCFRRTGHPFAASGGEPSQMIEFVFAASPETIRREPQEFFTSIAQSATCRTWQPARCESLLFSFARCG
jgi:hypothetical protein